MPIDPLAQLRDVIAPAVPGFWPPALGWWLLLALLCAMLLIVGFLYRRFKRRSPLDELNAVIALPPPQAVVELSILMRRIAITRFSRPVVASLCDEDWLVFLDQSGHTNQFTCGPGRILVSAPYCAIPPEQLQPLFEVCRNWTQTVA